MKHKWWLIGITLLLVLGLGWRWKSLNQFLSQNQQNVRIAKIGNSTLTLEVAQTPTELTQGLSGRPSLTNDGLLFILPQTTIPTFWMKDMLFAIDIVWLINGKVVEVTSNVPPPLPNTPETHLKLYSPTKITNQVLEVEAGNAAKWGLVEGAQLELK